MPEAPRVRSLWTAFSVETVAEAQEALLEREGVLKSNADVHIQAWLKTTGAGSSPIEIGKWARRMELEAVVWTALPPKFNGQDGTIPTAAQAMAYLHALPHEKRRYAEEYIRRAPRQIDTPYRRCFEKEFGWTPIS